MAFTKIVGAGIHTLSNVHTHNINSSGIITATQFVGLYSGTDGDFSGNVTIDGNLTVNGTTTTLDTNLTEVDKLEVAANNSTVGAAITQSGTGDILNLYDGSSEVFTVTDGGNVGVGSAIPAATVDIQGLSSSYPVLNIGGGGSTNGDLTVNSGESLQVGHWNRSTSTFEERLRITPDGKVGIGTDDPLTELHVHGETFTDITIHSQRTSGNIGGINFRKGGVTSGIMTAQYLVDVSGNHYFYSQGSQRLKSASDGDLTITGSDNAELKLKAGTSTGNDIIAFLNSSGTTKGNIFYDTDNNFMVFKTNGTASSNERLRITSDGRFSLGNGGNATPNAAFHLDYDSNNLFMLDNSTAATQKMFFAQDGGTHAQIYATSNSGALTIESDPSNNHSSSLINFKVDNVEQMVINNSGVGIGTDTTNGGLHIYRPDAQVRLYDTTTSGSQTAFRVMAYNGITHIQSGTAFTSDSKAPIVFGSMFGGTEWARIQSTGVVNIGDSTASSLGDRLLQIGKTDRSGTYIELRTSTSGVGGIVMSDGTDSSNTGYRGTIEYAHGSSNPDSMYFKTAAQERLRIKNDGNITQTGTTFTIDSPASAGLSLDRANTSSGATIDFKTAGTLKWYTGLRGLVNDNFYLRNEVGSEDSITITTDGYIGINDTAPYNGLTINKEGDHWDTNGNTYAHPEGRVLSTWRGDRNDDTDYWVGFVGKYLKPSATVNILLQPHVGNFNNQAGMYIAGEATGNFTSDFTLGAILSGNVAGRGTTASSGKRATKSELLRIKHDGRLLLGSNTNRTINSHVPKLQVTGTTYSNSTISIINNEANGNGAYIFLGKQRSGAVGGNTAVQANDIIGELRFPAGDGTDMENYAARIQVKADQNASSNNTSGYIDIYTTRQNGNSEHKMRMTQNSNNSHLFSMGTSTSHLNNATTPDRTSVKIGGLLHLEGPFGHNATPGMYYNCYSGGNDLFYRGTGVPSGGDRRPAAYGQKFGGHYFYGDNSSTAWSAQQQITSMQLNMNISSQGYVTKPQTPAFFATHTGLGNAHTGTLTYNSSGNGYYNNGGHLNLGTGKFTAPINGIYHFHFHGFFQTNQSNSAFEVTMRRINSNGSGVISVTRQYGYRNQPTNQYGPSISMHYTGPMTAGQTMEIHTGFAFHGSNGFFFGGHLVG